MDLRNSY